MLSLLLLVGASAQIYTTTPLYPATTLYVPTSLYPHCPSGLPLQAGGVNIMCGASLPSCPGNSYCVINTCCPLPASMMQAPPSSLYYPIYPSGPSQPQPDGALTSTAPTIPQICPDGRPRIMCPVNFCWNADCPGVDGAICMMNYCGTCGILWYAADGVTPVKASQCAWSGALPAQSSSFQLSASSQLGNLQVSAQTFNCPPAPNCSNLNNMMSNSQSNNQQGSQNMQGQNQNMQGSQNNQNSPSQNSQSSPQNQNMQNTVCQYKNPVKDMNGCITSCGTMVCQGPPRYLNLQVSSTGGLATWVAPLTAPAGLTYNVQMSYDGTTWTPLPLESPASTFVRFPVQATKPFVIRVIPLGYPAATQAFIPPH